MKNVFVVLAAGLSLVGCGGGICERSDAAQTKFFAGKTECSYTEMSNGATITVKVTKGTTSVSTCNMNISKCTSADQTVLDKYLKCAEAAPACAAGSEKAAADAWGACAKELITVNGTTITSNLSADCAAAFK